KKIMYWSLTGLFSAGMLMSSMMYLTHNEALVQGFGLLGYPIYLLHLLGTAKLLGAIALLQPWRRGIKEWAYAGFTFNLIGAIWSHLAIGDSAISPLAFLVLLAASYYLYRSQTSSAAKPAFA